MYLSINVRQKKEKQGKKIVPTKKIDRVVNMTGNVEFHSRVTL